MSCTSQRVRLPWEGTEAAADGVWAMEGALSRRSPLLLLKPSPSLAHAECRVWQLRTMFVFRSAQPDTMTMIYPDMSATLQRPNTHSTTQLPHQQMSSSRMAVARGEGDYTCWNPYTLSVLTVSVIRRRRCCAAQQQRRCSASLLLQQMKEPARHSICNLMRKWKQFATITARRRRVNSPDRYYEAFQETLQTLQHRCLKIDCIRATSWTIKYAKRDLPQVTMIILLHRAVTTPCSTSVASALESDFEDIANVAVVVTCSRKAFLRIAYRHLLP